MLKILNFLNLLDENNCLSITNVGLIALVTKIVVSPTADWPSIVAVIASFSNYAHKRYVNSQVQDPNAKQ